jgi:phosphatidylserine/phosphatidylglycerophosphate/cardiolipin synthase-like enzyme
MGLDDWLLEAAERGNPGTEIDRRHDHGLAWTEGNGAEVLIDGAAYFRRLHSALCECQPGEWIYFTDWQGDTDELLNGPGTEIGTVLTELAGRGVNVRGLLWRSHPELVNFDEGKNLELSRAINQAGGKVLLDHRVHRGGSHHQKLFIVRRADPRDDVAFVGGIDLCHGRRDDPRHDGDAQVAVLDDEHYGERPPWHDLQIELRGPVVDDLAYTFAERWHDPTPIDSRNPVRAVLHRYSQHAPEPGPLGPSARTVGNGPMVVQVLRTYPALRRGYPFAPAGERSIARAYLKAFSRARRLIYLEDQYLWSVDATRALVSALATNPELQFVAVIPRYPDPDGAISGPASRIGRERVLDALHASGPGRVAVYDIENRDATPIYVHSKVCIVDDVWIAVGSDNLNRRSWTHDSELSCAVIDSRRDGHAPRDPGGLGDGARVLARETRVRLATEHLGLTDADPGGRPPVDLIDPSGWFEALRASARALDAWHREGARGERPTGHLREHPVERVPAAQRWTAAKVHAALLDPDGRPTDLRRRGEF